MTSEELAAELERERKEYHAELKVRLLDGDKLQFPYKYEILKHYGIYSRAMETVFHRNDNPDDENNRSHKKIIWTDNGYSIQESNFESQTRECFAQICTDLDHGFQPLESSQILLIANEKLAERGYNIFFKNCEHFANFCRINKRICQQMTNALYWTFMIYFTILLTLKAFSLLTFYNVENHHFVESYNIMGFVLTALAIRFPWLLPALLYRVTHDNVINALIVAFIVIGVWYILSVMFTSALVFMISYLVVSIFIVYLFDNFIDAMARFCNSYRLVINICIFYVNYFSFVFILIVVFLNFNVYISVIPKSGIS